jgi:hypothetical protein
MARSSLAVLARLERYETVNGQLNGRDRCTLIGYIQRDAAHVVAVTLNQIGELLWIAGGGDQLVVSCENALSDRPTQPPSAPRASTIPALAST